MSMVNDVSKAHSKQMTALRRQQERELKFARDSHETVKAEQKKANQADLVNLQHENMKSLSEEQMKKERLLENMRSHLNQTRELTDRELKELETMTAEEKNKLDTKLALERERLTSNNELYLEDINHRFNSKSRKIQVDGQQRVADIERNQHEIFETKEQDYDRKINQQREQFTQKFSTDQHLYKKAKDEQDHQFKAQRMTTNRIQNSEIEKMNGTHESYKNIRELEFKKDLGAQETFFEKRYTETRNKYEADFQRLTDLNSKIINDTKKELATEVQFYATRSEDPFFQFTELRPTLKDLEGKIEITVPVPEHSKADLLLTLNGKDVTLTFNRRYVDVHKDEISEKRINKVESLTSKIATGHHLDSKSVKSSYENGVMTYTIKKA